MLGFSLYVPYSIENTIEVFQIFAEVRTQNIKLCFF